MTLADVAIVSAIATAQQGVDYSVKDGAVCPCCGAPHLRVVCTKAWDGDTRLRFHRCMNEGCVLAVLRTPIKSVQVV